LSGQIIDTFDDFLNYWSVANSLDLDQQIRLWQGSYMVKYPELMEKVIHGYEEENLDWREVAREKVFPKLSDHLQLMHEARENILAIHGPIFTKAHNVLRLDFPISLVIYVGIGCGAGWATRYAGLPAILVGLENVAESGWHTKERLQGLVSHEIGHLAHMAWRKEWERFEGAEQNPLFQLYSEGFAQRCEHLILGREAWHQAQAEGWINWCETHRGWLAQEFLKRLEHHSSVRDFFGSWFDIQGRKETGYFLGHEFIRNLEKSFTVREIALLDEKEVQERAIKFLINEGSRPP
jgi:hypothetical protein